MTNRFTIYYDCGINVPELILKFEGHDMIRLSNHSSVEVELEPGIYNLFAAYQLIVDNQTMDFEKNAVAVIEEGFDYTAKICMVLKSFTLLKKVGNSQKCC